MKRVHRCSFVLREQKDKEKVEKMIDDLQKKRVEYYLHRAEARTITVYYLEAENLGDPDLKKFLFKVGLLARGGVKIR